jgi:CubicO group peptidase (beta-lactamase class C family)
VSLLAAVLDRHVGDDRAPGAVALVARGDSVQVHTAGSVDLEGSAPMQRETIFRIASITKPIVAAAVMVLVDDGRIALDDPIASWLPELAAPSVVRTPESSLDEVVPAQRLITVQDLLSSTAGYGFPSNFNLPAVAPLFTDLKQGSPLNQPVPPPDEWMAILARIPMLHQPGEAWLYNTCSDIQGVLISRVSGQPLPDFLTERIFDPLGMVDTGFEVSSAQLHRFSSFYRHGPGGLELVDSPSPDWSRSPTFPSGAGGLVSTVDDWLAFGQMLLAAGSVGERRVLSPRSVALMTSDHLTAHQREAGRLFLEGQGWGFGGSVDVNNDDPWTTPGRYGWVGGTGTSAHIIPGSGTVSVLLTQLELDNPTPPQLMRDFWRYVARNDSGAG